MSDDSNKISRRKFLGTAGTAIAAALGYGTDIDGDGVNNGREILQKTDPLEPDSNNDGVDDSGEVIGEHSEIVQQAYEHAKSELYWRAKDKIVEFANDDDVNPNFIDEQLGIWLEAPPEIQENVLKANGLYKNDFTCNGVHHLEPDGTPGPAYEDPFSILTQDAFTYGFFNSTGKVHDIATGEYLGFQPSEGDKVGKLGDKNGRGTIANYLEGDINPEDLTGQRITVTWMDTSGPTDLVDQSFNQLERFFEQKPPGDISIDFYGINGVERDGTKPPEDSLITGNEAIDYYEANVPEELKGPVNYMILVNEVEGAFNAINTSPSPGGMGPAESSGFEGAVFYTLHELYWHGLTRKGHINKGREKTLASPPYTNDIDGLNYLDSEWDLIFDSMEVGNREYYDNILQ